MSSLIEELQRDALNHSLRVTELLHKSLVVASKLKLDEFASWIKLELEGYSDKNIPDYRITYGTPQVFNPYGGYQPLYCEQVEVTEIISKMPFSTPISEIEDTVIRAKNSNSGTIRMLYPPGNEKILMENMELSMQPSLLINMSQVQRILDAVRKIILEWSLKLEEDGITGEGMSFTPKEKELAQGNTYNVSTLIQGNVNGSQIQIDSTHSLQTMSFTYDNDQLEQLIKALVDTIEHLGIDEGNKKELRSEISTIESEIQSPNPKGKTIREGLLSIRRILEGAGGGVLASGLLHELGKLMSM